MFGDRPKELCEVETIDQKVLKQHEAHLGRLENFPLKKAEFYRNLQRTTGIKSVRGLSEITGEDWSYIARVLKTLELPESIQTFLKDQRGSEIVKYFNVRRLLEIARLRDKSTQVAKFNSIICEVRSEQLL